MQYVLAVTCFLALVCVTFQSEQGTLVLAQNKAGAIHSIAVNHELMPSDTAYETRVLSDADNRFQLELPLTIQSTDDTNVPLQVAFTDSDGVMQTCRLTVQTSDPLAFVKASCSNADIKCTTLSATSSCKKSGNEQFTLELDTGFIGCDYKEEGTPAP